ncbi:MAG: ABC transporter ATP-binding protein [Bauldia sp.]|nr:ABC transporter ATP-binding protein [Bauldia sp.]
MSALLAATGLTHAYRQARVLSDVSLSVNAGEFVAIIGANGSGKSTLLRILGRLLRPNAGSVLIDGVPLATIAPRAFARRVAFVPQGPVAPGDVVVRELVRRGRYPHRSRFGGSTEHDRAAIETAIARVGLADLADRPMGMLSGGERQRAWIALALAQEPALVLLDEPTTFLDIAHQLELLTLLTRLNREEGLTVVTVLHDIAQAAQHAGRIIGLRDGRVVADGPPQVVVTVDGLRALFGVSLRVMPDPDTGLPLVLPHAG